MSDIDGEKSYQDLLDQMSSMSTILDFDMVLMLLKLEGIRAEFAIEQLTKYLDGEK
jgi:hypothetical protein